ncbi:hypothetical protein BKA61DRAFT_138235 [Leptodontidium sp. MPI-SDFR-AT-0119]|nr:hypothetical protein BKA61DRAFT_138235 [Leptodontidium sp. MPI-SDFR-AT-0119]
MLVPIRPIRVLSIGRSILRQPFKSHPFVPSSAVWSYQGKPWLQSRAQRFILSSSMATNMSLPSPQRVLFDCLQDGKHDKWGWVIYRCTYDDDEGWNRFKRFIIQQSQANIVESDTPELADGLEWTFIEDRATLDGASKDQLRSRFKQWASEALKTEQPRVEDPLSTAYGNPRYTYFIHVDESALKSMVYGGPQPPKMDGRRGYVNFVDAEWKPLSEIKSDLGIVDEAEDEVHEPIDGCTEENVGWMRIALHMVGAEFYELMMGNRDVWYTVYKRSPQVSNW